MAESGILNVLKVTIVMGFGLFPFPIEKLIEIVRNVSADTEAIGVPPLVAHCVTKIFAVIIPNKFGSGAVDFVFLVLEDIW